MLKINYSTDGLKLLTKTPVVLDTMVLLRMFTDKSPYVDVLKRIKEECNKIIFSTHIVREWRTKAYVAGMSSLIVLRKLEELRQIKKLKRCNKAPIDRARKLIANKKCKKPIDLDDLKFVEVALARKADLITRDPILLNLNPYNCGKFRLKIMSPEDYLRNS